MLETNGGVNNRCFFAIRAGITTVTGCSRITAQAVSAAPEAVLRPSCDCSARGNLASYQPQPVLNPQLEHV